MEALTFKATTDGPDHETLSIIEMDNTNVTVCFDGDQTDTATMDHPTFDDIVGGGLWERVGFVEL